MADLFISYARDDDEAFVAQLHHDLAERGFTVWWDRKAMESRGRTFLQEIRDAITETERLILVIGPKAIQSDYVRVEWQFALETCKVVIPIRRLGESSLIPGELSKLDYLLVPDPLSQFHCPDFRSGRPYPDALDELVRILRRTLPPLAPLMGVDALPANFLPRAETIEQLSQSLLADILQPTVITSEKQTTALQGMGGIGKSVLAAAFARSCKTRRSFGDGILWLKFGQQPNVASNLALVGTSFDDSPQKYVDVQQGRTHLTKLLANKNCLLILDDLWNAAHAETFLNSLGTRCRLLITTRDGGLVKALGAQECRLNVLDDDQALQLLGQWAGQDAAALPAEARTVAAECGNLPLALSMVGAMVRHNPNRWGNVLHKLKNADLDRIRQQFPNYPYPDLLRAIQVSVEALEPQVQGCYLNLAVFPEDVPIPEAALQILWEPDGLDEYETQDVADLLENSSLLRRDESGKVSLHDLQRDYVRKQASDLLALHNRFLNAYASHCPEGWTSGPDDGYFFEHFVYHLAQAGRNGTVYSLIDKPWMEARFKLTHSHQGFADDVKRAIDVACAETPSNLAEEVRAWLIHSSLGALSSNVPVAALGTLVHIGQIAKARGLAALIQNPSEKMKAFRLMGLACLERDRKEEAKDLLLRVLNSEQHSSYPNISLLAGIATGLARLGELERFLEVANGIDDLDRRARLVCWASQLLALAGIRDAATDVAAKGLALARTMQETERKAEAMSRVAQALALLGDPAGALKIAVETRDIAKGIENDDSRAKALGELACAFALSERITETIETADQALVSGRRFEGSERVAYALACVGQLDRAFELCKDGQPATKATAEALTHKRDKEGLGRLLAYVSQELQGAYRAEGVGWVTQAWARLGEKDVAAQAALQAWKSADALLKPKSWASQQLCEIAYALALADEMSSAEIAIDAILSFSQTEKGFDFCDGRVEAVEALAESLVRAGEWSKALEFARSVEKEPPEQVRVLNRVATLLADGGDTQNATSIVREALALGRSIQDNSKRDRALGGIVDVLVRLNLFDQASTVADSIKDIQAEALMKLAPAFARAGQITLAVSLASRLLALADEVDGAPGWKVWIVKSVLDVLVETGSLEARIAGLFETIERIDDTGCRSEALSLVVKALANNEQFERAIELAESITDPGESWEETYRAESLAIVAEALSKSGRVDAALELLTKAPGDYEQSLLLSAVGGQLARLGERPRAAELVHQALGLVERVQEERSRCKALARALQAFEVLDDTADFDRILKLIRNIAEPYRKTEYLGSIVTRQALKGEVKRALALAAEMGEWTKSETLKAIAALPASERVLTEEMQLLDGMVYLPWRIDAQMCLGHSLVKSGEAQTALSLVHQALVSLEQSDLTLAQKGQSLSQIAGLLIALGQPHQALSVWSGEFKHAENMSRKNLFEILRHGASFLRELDNGKTLWQICQAIIQVEQWWNA